jgi:hypothetical protein
LETGFIILVGTAKAQEIPTTKERRGPDPGAQQRGRIMDTMNPIINSSLAINPLVHQPSSVNNYRNLGGCTPGLFSSKYTIMQFWERKERKCI